MNFSFLTDISSFYPSISNSRVHRFFLKTTNCCPDVARILTRICTYNYHLALGLVTSPILADQILRDVDSRISGLCAARNARYSRYVDDITISAKFDLKDSGIPKLICEIFADHGFRLNNQKTEYGRISEDLPITKIRLSSNQPDATAAYIAEVKRRISDHRSLASGGRFRGPFQSESQLRGKINFIAWVNPRRREPLLSDFQKIDWDGANREALRRGLVVAKKCTTRLGASPVWATISAN